MTTKSVRRVGYSAPSATSTRQPDMPPPHPHAPAQSASLPLVGRDGVGGFARVGQYPPSPIPSPQGGGVPPLTPPKD